MKNVVKVQLNLSVLILFLKNIGSIAAIFSKGLGAIGSMAAPLFIVSHVHKFRPIEFLIISVGIIFYLIEPYSIRVFMSLMIISIMFRSIYEQNISLNTTYLKIFLITICIFLVLGLGVSTFYDAYWFGNRYKFVYEDATLLGVYLLPFIALTLYFSIVAKSKFKVIYCTIFFLLYLCLLLTYSRMYIFLGVILIGSYIFFYKKKLFRYFIGILTIVLIYFAFKIDWDSLLYSLRIVGDDGGFNLTGRGFIWDMFFTHFNNLNWWNMFTPSVSQHLYKLNLELGAEGHSVVENSYFMTFLCGGFVGIVLLLWIVIVNVIKNRLVEKPFTFIFLFATMVVWLFDDSLGFPYSVFSQFFALYVVSQIENKMNEKSVVESIKTNK